MTRRRGRRHGVSGVYQIKHIASGKRYIGSSAQTRIRWVQHQTDLKGSYHTNSYLQRAWNKYGPEAFRWSILEEVSPEMLLEAEQKWIDQIRPEYNIALYAASSMRGRKASEETRAKLSKALKGRISNRKGQTMSKETRKAISESLRGNTNRRGKRASRETRQKMSASKIEWWETHGVSEDTREKLRRISTGKKFSEASKQKMREARLKWHREIGVSEAAREKLRKSHTGKKHTEESKRKMREARLKYYREQRES